VYITAQVVGGIVCVWVAHLMFELPLWQLSITVRTGPGQWLAEAVATFGLLLTIFGCIARTPTAVPFAVGLYITAALLVHRFSVLRQSRGDNCAGAFRHVRRHCSCRRGGLHRGAARGDARGRRPGAMALEAVRARGSEQLRIHGLRPGGGVLIYCGRRWLSACLARVYPAEPGA
jgi:hypothetical protein